MQYWHQLLIWEMQFFIKIIFLINSKNSQCLFSLIPCDSTVFTVLWSVFTFSDAKTHFTSQSYISHCILWHNKSNTVSYILCPSFPTLYTVIYSQKVMRQNHSYSFSLNWKGQQILLWNQILNLKLLLNCKFRKSYK